MDRKILQSIRITTKGTGLQTGNNKPKIPKPWHLAWVKLPKIATESSPSLNAPCASYSNSTSWLSVEFEVSKLKARKSW